MEEQDRKVTETSRSFEGFLTLSQAAKRAPGRPSTNCVWRWCRKGIRSRNGRRIQLRHVRVGRKIYTTEAWLNEFGHSVAEADAEHLARETGLPEERAAHRPRAARQREEAIKRAERELREAGA